MEKWALDRKRPPLCLGGKRSYTDVFQGKARKWRPFHISLPDFVNEDVICLKVEGR